jgi:hypothetical protein
VILMVAHDVGHRLILEGSRCPSPEPLRGFDVVGANKAFKRTGYARRLI